MLCHRDESSVTEPQLPSFDWAATPPSLPISQVKQDSIRSDRSTSDHPQLLTQATKVSLCLQKNIMSHPNSPPRTVLNRWTCTQSSQSGRILHHFHRPTFSGWLFFRGVGRVEKNVESSSDCVPPKLMLSMMSISSSDSFRPHCRAEMIVSPPAHFSPPSRPVHHGVSSSTFRRDS